ncbi:hypothetical protein EH243_08920 [Amphritea opalescens]|uniref:Uncharacterized protein n=1 Tax=Amphritea opalescens TaxID=2490544 RepID=A0A430KRU9_9GAMM|nr:hypothetical protein [Amphritea opalescens]RTE66227.1 hypothetical protein EH243_08920 [Amphritea opalescens]
MLTTYYYIDLYNKQTQNRPESEREYFMRMAYEMEQTRITEKRAARKQKMSSLFAAVARLFKVKRTPSLESLYGH